MQKKKINSKAIIMGMLAAGITFISGFGIIYLMWINIGTMDNLPGLFDYRAATYGDAVCLPLLIGTMTAFIKMNAPIDKKNKRSCLLFGVSAAIAGAGIQASWLISDNTGLNWTIPIPHYFNVAGWYHSVFFIVMFFAIAYLVTCIYYVTKNKDEFSFGEQIDLILFVSSGALFVLCFLSDDYAFIFDYGTGFAAVAALFFAVLLFVLKNRSKAYRNIIFIIATGIIIASGIFSILFMRRSGNWVLALAGTVSTCFLWRDEKSDIKKFSVITVLFFLGSFGLFYLLTSDINLICKIVVIIIFAILLALIDGGIIKKQNESGSIILILVYLCSSKIIKAFANRLSNLISSIFLTFVYVVFDREIRDFFDRIINAEEKKNDGIIDNREFVKNKTISYIKIVCGIISITVLIADWLVSFGKAYGKSITNGEISFDNNLLILMITGIIALLFIGILRTKKIRNKFTETIAAILIIAEYIFLFLNCLMHFQSGKIYKLPVAKLLVMIFAVFANIGAALMVGHGFRMNLTSLRGLPKRQSVNIVSKIMSIGCFCVSYSSSILVVLATTWLRVASLFLTLLIAFVITPIISALCYKDESIKSDVVPNEAIGGVAQDGLMTLLIVMFASYFVCIYCGMMSDMNFFSAEVLDFLIGLFVLLGIAFIPVMYCLTNNRNHLIRQRRVAIRVENGMQRWEVLRKEIVIQSYQTCVAMLPYILLIIIAEIFTECVKRKNEDSLKKEFLHLKSKYIEADSYDDEKKEDEGNEDV